MARKNILSGLLDQNRPQPAELPPVAPETKSAVPPRGLGALGAVTRSIDALAAKAEAAERLEAQLAAGAVIVDLDPVQIENSFVSDRIGDDEEAFRQLVEAIRERGQDSPILVRPHPDKPNLYQIAFGHRRARAARELGIPVKAVVKPLSDTEHVIAQGQENSARADLSFIERALFASRLEQRGFSREVMMTALGLDKTTLSKMLSVCNRIPGDILHALDLARGIGRDRWHELATLFDTPGADQRARHFMNQRPYRTAKTLEERFLLLLRFLKEPAEAAPSRPATVRKDWARPDGAVRAKIADDGKTFTIALKAARAADFGAYLTAQLDRLYEAFERENANSNGD